MVDKIRRYQVMKLEVRPQERIDELAVLIADGGSVDWNDVGIGDSDKSIFQGMQIIEHVMQSHRRVNNQSEELLVKKPSFGALEVIEKISAGAQGEVWLAYDPFLDLQVALKLHKVESGALAHQFLEEARKLARVRQANIVSVYGAAVHDYRAGIWIELIRGESLSTLLTDHGPFPSEEVREIGLKLCEALAAVHSHGLIHGDIKLQNIMRESTGRVVLLDFGAAREMHQPQTSIISGTIQYIAPEVLAGFDGTPASDLYALGVVLFRLLTGRFPYASDDMVALERDHAKNSRTPVGRLCANLPPELAIAIDRALDPNPINRFTSMNAFSAALRLPPIYSLRSRRILFAKSVIVASIIALLMIIGAMYIRPVQKPTWDLSLALYKISEDGGVPLPELATITPEDHLELRLTTNHPIYLYVFDDDGSNETEVLFPLRDASITSPTIPVGSVTIPGTSEGSRFSWQIKTIAAREEIIVVASESAIPSLSSTISQWQSAPKIAAQNSGRGNTYLVAAPPESEMMSSKLRNALAPYLDGDAQTTGVKTWRFRLKYNPQ